MRDRKVSASARTAAAAHLLDRGFGRAPQFVSTRDAGPSLRARDLSDDKLAQIIAGARPAPPVTAEREAEQLPRDPKRPITH